MQIVILTTNLCIIYVVVFFVFLVVFNFLNTELIDIVLTIVLSGYSRILASEILEGHIP